MSQAEYTPLPEPPKGNVWRMCAEPPKHACYFAWWNPTKDKWSTTYGVPSGDSRCAEAVPVAMAERVRELEGVIRAHRLTHERNYPQSSECQAMNRRLWSALDKPAT